MIEYFCSYMVFNGIGEIVGYGDLTFKSDYDVDKMIETIKSQILKNDYDSRPGFKVLITALNKI